MKTTISKKFEVEEPIGKVWNYLSDPTKIVSCVPGAALTEKLDDSNYRGGVTLKFGPIKASYEGQITFEEMDEANHKMTLNGKGLDSKGTGSADMLMKSNLVENGNGTEVDCSMEITIIGKLAQFGSRLVNDVSDQLFDQFVANFKKKLAADTSYVAAAKATATMAAASIASESVAASETAASAVSSAAASTVSTVTSAMSDLAESAMSGAENGMGKVKETITTNVTEKRNLIAKKVEISQPEGDNSLNAFSLLWTLIKGFFGRMFGGGK